MYVCEAAVSSSVNLVGMMPTVISGKYGVFNAQCTRIETIQPLCEIYAAVNKVIDFMSLIAIKIYIDVFFCIGINFELNI